METKQNKLTEYLKCSIIHVFKLRVMNHDDVIFYILKISFRFRVLNYILNDNKKIGKVSDFSCI